MLKWFNKKRNKKGFTLIELVVVIAILGILAAIAVPRLSGFRDTAEVAADEASAETIAKAAELYVASHNVKNPSVLNGYFLDSPEALKDMVDTDSRVPQQGGKKFVLTYVEDEGFKVTIESDSE